MENTNHDATRELYTNATRQIFTAVHLDDSPASEQERLAAWAEVSKTEEVIAATVALSALERGIAQRGAIEAAVKSVDRARADELRAQYGI